MWATFEFGGGACQDISQCANTYARENIWGMPRLIAIRFIQNHPEIDKEANR
jgi:hypothetical protein